MKTSKYTSKDFKVSSWSGGTTTELFIHPENADFKSKNFDFRLSIATINISSSDFTPLEGVNRTLLLLEGELKLIHEDHHESFLMPLSQDSFKGGWNTHCVGIGADFNLMTRNCNGTVSVYQDDITLDEIVKYRCLYCREGNATMGNQTLTSNELLVIQHPDSTDLKVEGIVIVVDIM